MSLQDWRPTQRPTQRDLRGMPDDPVVQKMTANPFGPENISEMDRWELVAIGIEDARKNYAKGGGALQASLFNLIESVSILYNFVKPPSARKVAD